MLRWCWLATLAACGFSSPGPGGSNGPDASTGIDAPPDASVMPDGTQAGYCFGSFVRVCLVQLPIAQLNINSGDSRSINTNPNSGNCDQTTSDAGACVVAATSISLNGLLRATGSRPLILVATEEIRINSSGAIDVSSKRGAIELGAGANSSACVDGTTANVLTGGAGGTNIGKGGDGDLAGIAASGGMASNPLQAPSTLRGGCRGGTGAGLLGGAGGNGGGAVDLIAPTIVINGTINASGAGASAAGTTSGGGGGGSGGLIVLDSPDLTVNSSAAVFAQGGSGSEGGSGGAGTAGRDPTVAGQAALGGDGSGSGGSGGAGATTGNGENGGPDSNGSNLDGGGGGGGGAGFIKTTDPTPPTSVPTTRVCPTFS